MRAAKFIWFYIVKTSILSLVFFVNVKRQNLQFTEEARSLLHITWKMEHLVTRSIKGEFEANFELYSRLDQKYKDRALR